MAVAVTKNIKFGGTYTYDDAFESRASADLTIRFARLYTNEKRQDVQKLPVITGLSSSPSNRDVRVHDDVDDSKMIKMAPGHDTCPLGYVNTSGRTCVTPLDLDVAPSNGQACKAGWINIGAGYCKKNEGPALLSLNP